MALAHITHILPARSNTGENILLADVIIENNHDNLITIITCGNMLNL
jgi:hypothetical protein